MTNHREDASNYAFITNASESGGTLFTVRDKTQLPDALHLVRQAYERATE